MLPAGELLGNYEADIIKVCAVTSFQTLGTNNLCTIEDI